ncbi:hypothetical protein RFI_10850 [Reticulomyxa filosa]|uniref:Uncharacterized protein n=1 Tax=Reticulomyxa filosa TaxID=46433 RepID=X6NIY5_RETFI|nr:hypothetical protein RFI_10850 [Reticulomyxa filosa]|eukprot:ETO26290.1 hypothetical protein RFI_10850 [Reticulomyxa filosa]
MEGFRFYLFVLLFITKPIHGSGTIIEGCRNGFLKDRNNSIDVCGMCLQSNNVVIKDADVVEIWCNNPELDCGNGRLYVSNTNTVRLYCGYEGACSDMSIYLESIVQVEVECYGSNACFNNKYEITSVEVVNIACYNQPFSCQNVSYSFDHINNVSITCQGKFHIIKKKKKTKTKADRGCSDSEWHLSNIDQFWLKATRISSDEEYVFVSNILQIEQNVTKFLLECSGLLISSFEYKKCDKACLHVTVNASAATSNVTIECDNKNSYAIDTEHMDSNVDVICPEYPDSYCQLRSNGESNFEYYTVYSKKGFSSLNFYSSNLSDVSSFQNIMLFAGHQYQQQYLCNWNAAAAMFLLFFFYLLFFYPLMFFDFLILCCVVGKRLFCNECNDCRLSDYYSDNNDKNDTGAAKDSGDGDAARPMFHCCLYYFYAKLENASEHILGGEHSHSDSSSNAVNDQMFPDGHEDSVANSQGDCYQENEEGKPNAFYNTQQSKSQVLALKAYDPNNIDPVCVSLKLSMPLRS